MGSKGPSAPSGNTTTTVQNTNPTATAQLPYLQQLWGGAANLAGQGSGSFASDQLYNLQNYAANQGWNTDPLASGVMPAALQQYINQISQGSPAAAQASQLAQNAEQAVNQGLGFSQGLAGAANTALGQVPDWQNRFLGAGQTAADRLQGLGSNAIGALSGVGNYAMGTLPGLGMSATSALTGLAPGALGGLSSLSGRAATAGNPAERGLGFNAASALANPAFASGLTGLASGRYIDPATNPAYAGMIQGATQPLINAYQTAIAPQIDSRFAGAGRYGSGAQTNAIGQAQSGLAQGLGNAISNITNNAYTSGLQATLSGGQALGGLYNQGISNITGALSNMGQLAQSGGVNAANILNQGYGTAGNLLNQGYGTGGNLINQGVTGATNALGNAYQIGGGLTGAGANALNAFMANAGSQGLGYLNAGMSGLNAAAQAAQGGYGTANTALTGSGNLLNLGSQALTNALGQAPNFATYPQSEYTTAYNAPWTPYKNLAGILGTSVGGTGTRTDTSPYYNNTGANILSGLTGGLGLANQIGGANGLFPGAISGLFGGGGAAGGDALAGIFAGAESAGAPSWMMALPFL